MPTNTVPFPVASRPSTRQAFTVSSTALNASSNTVLNPVSLPSDGYLRSILLEVTGTITGGTTPAYTADAPWNVIQSISFTPASGQALVTPITGYQLYLINKYGGYGFTDDPRNPVNYSATTTGFHFFIRIPLEIDKVTGYCSIPNLAANRSYRVDMTLAPVSTVMTGAPSISVAVTAYSEFWLQPTASTSAPNPVAQNTSPMGLGAYSFWQFENPSVTPGDFTQKLSNVGSVLRTVIFVARDSTGARIADGNGFPSSGELDWVLDGDIDLAFTTNMWKQYHQEWFGFNTATLDTWRGLDTGVYVFPFHAMNGSRSGDPNNTRSQLLPTGGASQLQLKATFGSTISKLEILTNSVSIVNDPNGLADLWAR